jgi:hypothetical protein
MYPPLAFGLSSRALEVSFMIFKGRDDDNDNLRETVQLPVLCRHNNSGRQSKREMGRWPYRSVSLEDGGTLLDQ